MHLDKRWEAIQPIWWVLFSGVRQTTSLTHLNLAYTFILLVLKRGTCQWRNHLLFGGEDGYVKHPYSVFPSGGTCSSWLFPNKRATLTATCRNVPRHVHSRYCYFTIYFFFQFVSQQNGETKLHEILPI